jgi:hypothetical protein
MRSNVVEGTCAVVLYLIGHGPLCIEGTYPTYFEIPYKSM